MSRSLALVVLLAAAPATPAPAVSWSDSALSVFRHAGRQTSWTLEDPGRGAKRELARLPGNLTYPQAAFAPDRRVAAIYAQEPPALWRVTLASGKVEPLSLPPLGRLARAGYDAAGRLLAFTLDRRTPSHDAKGPHWRFAGRRYDADAPIGTPALAHAFELHDGVWQRVETAGSATDACDTPGIHALERSARVPETLAPDVRPAGTWVEAGAEAARLAAFAPGVEGGWVRLRGAAPAAWVFLDGEYASGRIAIEAGGRLRAPAGLGWGPRDVVSVVARGNWLLVAEDATSRARLVDLRAAAMRHDLGKVAGAAFWPAPARGLTPPGGM